MIILRIVTGLILLGHGIPKFLNINGFVDYLGSIVGSPLNWVVGIITLLVEVGAGLMLLIGMKTRLSGLAVGILFLGISIFVHGSQFFLILNTNAADGQSQFEYPFLIAAIGFSFFMMGGGINGKGRA